MRKMTFLLEEDPEVFAGTMHLDGRSVMCIPT